MSSSSKPCSSGDRRSPIDATVLLGFHEGRDCKREREKGKEKSGERRQDDISTSSLSHLGRAGLGVINERA